MPLPGLQPWMAAPAVGGELSQATPVALNGALNATVAIPAAAPNLVLVGINGMTCTAGFGPVFRAGDSSGDAVANYVGLGYKPTNPVAAYTASDKFNIGGWVANSFVNGIAILQRFAAVPRFAHSLMLAPRTGSQYMMQHQGGVGNPTALPGTLARYSMISGVALSGGVMGAIGFNNAVFGYAALTVGPNALLTGIPAGTKLVFVTWQSALCSPRLRLGTVGGVVAAGYDSECLIYNIVGGSQDYNAGASTAGFDTTASGNNYHQGTAILTLADSVNNVWSCAFSDGETSTSGNAWLQGGMVTLPGPLDRVELSSVGGGNFGAAGGWFAYAAVG